MSYRLSQTALVFGVIGLLPTLVAQPAGEPLRLRAAHRGGPYLNLRDGQALRSNYIGDWSHVQALKNKQAKPLSMASADFDEDGVPDLICGYTASDGLGIVTIHRGNIDALWPYGAALRNGEPPPFHPDVRVFGLPEAPDFLGAGDFDADGHWDIVAARRGSSVLWLLPGDGHGGFGEPQRRELSGTITSFATGEINRADGLTDFVVGVESDTDARALAFESPLGAWRADPEEFPLPAAASGFALAALDRGFRDLVIAAGHDLLVVHGRDRKLSLEKSAQRSVLPAEVTRQSFPFELRSIALGSFSDKRLELAALGNDDKIHLLGRTLQRAVSEAHIAPGPPGQLLRVVVTQPARKLEPASGPEWFSFADMSVPGGQALVAGHISAAGPSDLIVLDRKAKRLHIMSAAPHKSGRNGLEMAASLDVESGEPAAVLSMRLNQHPLSGLVMLDSGQSEPQAATSNPANTFVVTNTNDSGAGSLRQAILDANAAQGSSAINFNIPNTDPNRDPNTGVFLIQPQAQNPGVACPPGSEALPIVTSVVTIDGYTQPGASPNTLPNGDNAVILIQVDGAADTTLGGEGLNLSQQVGFTVRGMDLTNWFHPCASVFHSGAGLYMQGSSAGFIEGNFSGIDATGMKLAANEWGIYDDGGPTFGGYGSGPGFAMVSPGNIIGGTTPQARNIFSGNLASGAVMDCPPFQETLAGNFIGPDRSGAAAILNGNGGVIVCATGDTIGGTAAGAGNVISGNNVANVEMTGGTASTVAQHNLVQGNLIGTDATGTKSISSPPIAAGIALYGGGSAGGPAAGNTIGGPSTARNVISGNPDNGVVLNQGVLDNLVQGNYIGLDITGAKAVGNGGVGVGLGAATQISSISGPASNNPVGGAVPGTGNVISGNALNGVEIQGLVNNGSEPPAHLIQGNLIGTDATGTMPVGNMGAGVALGKGTYNSTIGGTDTIPRNIIAFNGKDGILIDPGAMTPNQNNQVLGNTIFANGGAGVRVNSGNRNPISRNSIFSNAKLGIDIGSGNPNINTNCQSSTSGPNNLQNAPTLTAASGNTLISATATDPNNNTSDFSNCVAVSGSSFSVLGTFNGAPSTTFTIEFFKNDSCDASGFGQGKTFIGSTTVTTAPSCTAPINQNIDLSKAELSVTLKSTFVASLGSPIPGVLTSVVTNNGAASAHNVTVTDTLPATLSFVSATATQGSCSNSANSITCNLGTMVAGATSTIVIQYGVVTTGSAMDTIAVSASETDPNPANNSASVTLQPQNAFPAIDHFDPPSVVAGRPDLMLNVYGQSFISGVTTVTFNGTPLQVAGLTTLASNGKNFSYTGCPHGALSCQQLTVLVPASMLATPGTPTIVAMNPTPGGGSSSSANLPLFKQFQVLASCSYTVSPNTAQNIGNGICSGGIAPNCIGGFTLTFAVTATPTSCAWSNSSSVSWMLPNNPGNFEGNNSAVSFGVLPNGASQRSGTITIADKTITVNQAGGLACYLTLSAISDSYPASGGSGSFTILDSPVNCLSWTATSDSSWLTITSPAASDNFNANGVIAYTVAANSGPSRSGHISVPGAGTFTVIQSGTGVAPTLSLSRHTLNYGYSGSLITSPQPILVNFTGAPGVAWTASSNQSNITVMPASGSGNGMFQVVVTAGPSGVVTVTAPGAIGSPQQVQVNVRSVTPAAPFGSFDTPLDNTMGVIGAIPVTGWALDNIEVTKVDIWREPVGNEPPGNLLYIGDAVFVIGARPDVEAANPNLPWQFRAGFGYLMLTNFLPNGNGTFKLHAIAHDMAGFQTDLGTRTITVDNAHAMKPFGTIDTPTQGGTASGSAFVNFGWALTQNPGCVPTDGSTLTVYIDGVALPGHPTYNNKRNDIATLFPGLCNSNGAIGFYVIDTTKLSNAVHTIFWIVTDSVGHAEGLGSRYFNAFNSGTTTPAPVDEPIEPSNINGPITVDAEELDRIELHPGAKWSRTPLPIGSTLKGGVFYWHLGPGFTSTYSLVFERADGTEIPVTVRVRPKDYRLLRPTVSQ